MIRILFKTLSVGLVAMACMLGDASSACAQTTTIYGSGGSSVFTTGTGDLVVVPEPSTYAMAIAGLACGGWRMIRRRRLKAA